jgi:ABC-2 type transport system ATP-binding protein
MTAIVLEHVTKRFGDFAAVDDVSFEVPDGQLLAVLGPNGAGKTITLEMLEGFLVPTSGTVRVLGADPRHGGRAWRARVGLVLQSTSLDPEPTVRDTLSLYAPLYPHPYKVDEVLELVDLTADAQTRVDLAIGIIGRPDILFLDEPTTGLDPEARRRTWAAVENLASTGTTVVLTTHYIDEADHLADRIIVLVDGRLVTDTTPCQLRAKGGPSTIRYPLADGAAADLPSALAHHLDPAGRTIVIRSTDVTGLLRVLVGWADRDGIDLTGLEIGPPSLEDAYLTTIGEPTTPKVRTYA